MTKLTYLDLSNTGMTNINSINNLISSLKTLKLYHCDFSNNNFYLYFNNLSIDELFIDNTDV